MTTISLRTRALLAGAAAAGLLSACTTVGPQFTPPAAPDAKTYFMAGDERRAEFNQAAIGDKVVAEWWTLFRSPTLDNLVREAIAHNRSLEEARARLAEAHEKVGAESGLLFADASGGVKRERANLNAFSGGAFGGSNLPGGLSFPTNPEFNLYSVGPSVSYNLDLFGGKRRRIESLQATAESQARQLDAAYLALTGQVVAQVLTVADATINIQDLSEIVASDQMDLDMLVKAQAAGGASAADVAQAQGVLAQDQSQIPAQRQRLSTARHRLATLIGKRPDQFDPPVFETGSGALPTVAPVSLPSELVRQRPDILEAEARLHAATAEIGVATANLYPNITLSANFGIDALTPGTLFDQSSTSWALGAGLTAPLFHSGELKAKQREAQDEARAALAAYEETVLEAFNQVADALTAVSHANQAYVDQTRALEAAKTRLDMARKAYGEGGVSADQVVRVERDWRRTRLAVSQQSVGRYAGVAQLLLATANVPSGAALPAPSAEAQHSGQ